MMRGNMTKKRIGGFLGLSVFVIFLSYCNISYGYVEPVRKVLPKTTETELTNPDLPKRKGIKIGEIILHSAVSTGLRIDPNIYLSSQDEKYDLVYVETASFGIEVPIQTNKISIDYEAIENHYERFHSNDHVDQRVRGLISLDLTDYRITVREVFRHFTELPGSANTSRLKQDTNDVRAGITRETAKFGFDVGYTNSIHTYHNDDSISGPLTYKDRSSVKHIADMSVGYRFLQKTSVVVEDDYGISEYESANSPDYYFNDILAGLKGEVYKNLSAHFLAGYRYQYFKEASVMFDDTFSGFICRGGLKYAISDDDVLDMAVERSVNDSTYQDITYYTANFVGFNYMHIFTDKISGQAFVTYQRNDYPTETTEGVKTAERRDNAYGAGLSLRYDIRRWLSAEVGYEFKKARSNFRTFGYEDHIASFKVTAGF